MFPNGQTGAGGDSESGGTHEGFTPAFVDPGTSYYANLFHNMTEQKILTFMIKQINSDNLSTEDLGYMRNAGNIVLGKRRGSLAEQFAIQEHLISRKIASMATNDPLAGVREDLKRAEEQMMTSNTRRIDASKQTQEFEPVRQTELETMDESDGIPLVEAIEFDQEATQETHAVGSEVEGQPAYVRERMNFTGPRALAEA